MGRVHLVEQGDCLDSIAAKAGLSAETVWFAGENDALRATREDFNVLFPGDQVFVPDLDPVTDSASTGSRHRFQVSSAKIPLCLILEDEDGVPRQDLKFVLTVGRDVLEGVTGPDGLIEHLIEAAETTGSLRITPDDLSAPEEEYEIAIGGLDPDDEVSGVQARLANLGFDTGAIDGRLGPRTSAAIEAFQEMAGLDSTGSLDHATRAQLRAEHGV